MGFLTVTRNSKNRQNPTNFAKTMWYDIEKCGNEMNVQLISVMLIKEFLKETE